MSLIGCNFLRDNSHMGPNPVPEKLVRPKKVKPVNQSVEIVQKFGMLARVSGCPSDQAFNFIKAGVFLQPKQLEFCALARECDNEFICCPNCSNGEKSEFISKLTGETRQAFLRENKFKEMEGRIICEICEGRKTISGPKMILAGGGRGSAKSHGIFAQIFCDDCQRVPGLKFLFLRKVGQSNKEQVSDFVTKLLTNLPHKYQIGRASCRERV